MVKFLFAKEKTWVRFPLSAQNEVIYFISKILNENAKLTAGDKPEEGEDDVKSSCPLCPGRHTCYNCRDKGSRSREGELTPKTRPQFGLQAATRLHEAGIASNRRSAIQRIPQEILPGLPVQGNEDRIIQLTVSQSTVCIPVEITDPTTLANLSQFNMLMISMKHDFLNSITPPGYIESLQRELNNTPAELLAGKLESMYQYELTSLSNYYQSFGYSDQHYLNYLDFCNERYHSVVPNPVETFIPSPLEQFSILPLIPMKIGNLYLSFTNSSLFMLLTLSLVLRLIHFVTKKGGGNVVPNAWQSLVELIYDFVLNLGMIPYSFTVTITSPAFGISLLAVKVTTSGMASSHSVTGGVYKAREQIHRRMADWRLLAIPASCRRVAACNPN
ncbi:hypothetical protein E3N88_18061 [Mikania micrantha]|uniref:F-ATPase protein 6 n=1 Tax=Mikania micrantha TaxID=192012 RepID=A0A5N6NVU7_9ASTR|nr:hypothetical protein E3N88_18061 [Mikania micrantha]